MFRSFGATVSIFRVSDLVQMDDELVGIKIVKGKGKGRSESERLVSHKLKGRNRRQRRPEPMGAKISKEGPLKGFTLKMEAMWLKRHNI
jgi:hypothetical protein